ncbi:MAG: hypothetical protein OJF50_003200 [Nitrospira sp.]|nr:hypothetical protein [Nitrospira sp.]
MYRHSKHPHTSLSGGYEPCSIPSSLAKSDWALSGQAAPLSVRHVRAGVDGVAFND